MQKATRGSCPNNEKKPNNLQTMTFLEHFLGLKKQGNQVNQIPNGPAFWEEGGHRKCFVFSGVWEEEMSVIKAKRKRAKPVANSSNLTMG